MPLQHLEADAEPKLIGAQIGIDTDRRTGNGVGLAAEVGVAVFEATDNVVGDSVLDTGTDRVPDKGVTEFWLRPGTTIDVSTSAMATPPAT